MRLYHLDRTGSIVLGQALAPLPLPSLPQEVRESQFVKEFASGVSHFGRQYLSLTGAVLSPHFFAPIPDPFIYVPDFALSKTTIDCHIIEFVFELIRRAYFPAMPSRFTSFFGLSSPEELKKWPELSMMPASKLLVWDASDDTRRFDANHLQSGYTFRFSDTGFQTGFILTLMFDSAIKYWSGESTPEPRWEYLCPLPISGLRLADAEM